jgi:CBS domain-containing protein
MACTIEHLVRESAASLDEDATVERAAAVMADLNAGCLVVTRDEAVVGLFTERDLVKRVVAQGKDAASVTLKEVATGKPLVTIAHDSSCQEAIHKMQRNRCRRLVVFRGERFAGLVSLPNVAYALAEQNGERHTLANLFVGLAAVVAVIVILIMLYLLPEMLDVAQDVTGP